MKFLKEISHFFRFFRRLKEKEKEIVFYAESRDYFPNFEGIIDHLTEKYQQTLCYITSDFEDPIFQHPSPSIKAFYLKSLLPLFMILVKCKVFVMTLTDLDNFHLKRSSHPVHYVYVFHSLVSTHMMYRKGAFHHYDSLLCVGPHHIRELREQEKKYNLKPRILVEAGYYRLERIYHAYRNDLKYKQINRLETPTVLVAPSWGDKNVLETCGDALIKCLLEKKYRVIVRPHPQAQRKTPQLIDSLETTFKNNPGFTLERTIVTDDSLLNADVLISDCSGIALEYAFATERPVIFMKVPLKIKNPDYKESNIQPLEITLMETLGVTLEVKDIPQLPALMENLIDKKNDFSQQIRSQREQHVFAFDESSIISARHIMNLLDNKPPKGERNQERNQERNHEKK